MNISDLIPGDVGKLVTYGSYRHVAELGRIKSWNEHYVFVVFERPGHPEIDLSWQAQPCRAVDLRLVQGQ